MALAKGPLADQRRYNATFGRGAVIDLQGEYSMQLYGADGRVPRRLSRIRIGTYLRRRTSSRSRDHSVEVKLSGRERSQLECRSVLGDLE